MSARTSLVVENIRKSYGKRLVVKDISFHLQAGEVVGLLGPNGAGKTTSFYMIAGIVPKDAGLITLDGIDIGTLPMHKRSYYGIAYLPQEASVFRRMTVYDNILSVLELHNRTLHHKNRNNKSQVDEIMSELHISHLKDSVAESLSGGERRRVEIARVLVQDPKIVLLDEPFAGVDPIAVGDIQHLIELLQRKNIGVLITDHNVRETLGICTRSYIISEGTVVAQGTAAEIVANPIVRKVYLGENFTL